LTTASKSGTLSAMIRSLPMYRKALAFSATAIVAAALTNSALQSSQAVENWPNFRGPSGQGLTDAATKLPTEWGEDKNVAWKVAINGKAWSTPVIWGDQVWVSNADEGGARLTAHCFDKNTGKEIHKVRCRNVPAPQYCHPFNSYGSPSPVIEEGRLYITFGSAWTGCIDTASGKVLWERIDLKCNHFRGPGSSLFMHGDNLYLNFDGSDFQYIIALDKKTGETVWKTDRTTDFHDVDAKGEIEREGDWRKAYSTPRIITATDGKEELVSIGSMAIYGYDPASGEELWRYDTPKMHSTGGTPVIGDGLIYAPTGSGGELFAIKPGGSGVLDDSAIAWRHKKVNPKRSSPLLIEDRIYCIDDGGILACLDAKTGDPIFLERVGATYSASPIYADGKIWLFDEEGKGTVIEAGREFKKVSENQLESGCMASPAVSGNALFVRTKTHLYKIAQ
jgi:outer membrane protein assembly factor BamB